MEDVFPIENGDIPASYVTYTLKIFAGFASPALDPSALPCGGGFQEIGLWRVISEGMLDNTNIVWYNKKKHVYNVYI